MDHLGDSQWRALRMVSSCCYERACAHFINDTIFEIVEIYTIFIEIYKNHHRFSLSCLRAEQISIQGKGLGSPAYSLAMLAEKGNPGGPGPWGMLSIYVFMNRLWTALFYRELEAGVYWAGICFAEFWKEDSWCTWGYKHECKFADGWEDNGIPTPHCVCHW